MKKPKIWYSLVIFVVFAVIYFIKPLAIPHKICFPMFLLFALAVDEVPWQMCLAMLFSALGDYAGSCHVFLAQMGFFAVAHVLMVAYFLTEYFRKGPEWRETKEGQLSLTLGAAITMAAVILAFWKVIPCAPEGVVKIGASIYCIVIATMMLGAILQRNFLLAAGAILFLISDLILSWNKFVSPIPAERYLIMVPYYLGQFLLFAGVFRCRKDSSLRSE